MSVSYAYCVEKIVRWHSSPAERNHSCVYRGVLKPGRLHVVAVIKRSIVCRTDKWEFYVYIVSKSFELDDLLQAVSRRAVRRESESKHAPSVFFLVYCIVKLVVGIQKSHGQVLEAFALKSLTLPFGNIQTQQIYAEFVAHVAPEVHLLHIIRRLAGTSHPPQRVVPFDYLQYMWRKARCATASLFRPPPAALYGLACLDICYTNIQAFPMPTPERFPRISAVCHAPEGCLHIYIQQKAATGG